MVKIECKTSNSWFINGKTPTTIIRNIPLDEIHPQRIEFKECEKIVETDQTFQIEEKKLEVYVVPKNQVLEIQYEPNSRLKPMYNL